MIVVISYSGSKRMQKRLLRNITEELLKKDIAIDKANIVGNKIEIECDDEVMGFDIIKKIFGVEEVRLGEKSEKGPGGYPTGSKGRVFMDDVDELRFYVMRKGLEIVDDLEEADAVISRDMSWKKKGYLVLDFSHIL